MISLHPQDSEFLDLCKQLDGKIGIILILDAKNPGIPVPPGVSPEVLIAVGLNQLVAQIQFTTHVKPTLLPIIGTIPDNTRLAGLKYAMKVVSVDEYIVEKQKDPTPVQR